MNQASLDRALQIHDLKTLYTVLKEEINYLKEQLQKERDDKEKIIEWIKVNLGPNMGQVKTLIQQEVKSQLAQQQEIEKRERDPFLTAATGNAQILFSDAKPKETPTTSTPPVKNTNVFSEARDVPNKSSSVPIKVAVFPTKSVETAPSKRTSVVLPKPPIKEEEKPIEPSPQTLTKSASLSNIDSSQKKVEPQQPTKINRKESVSEIKKEKETKSDGKYYSDEEWSSEDDSGNIVPRQDRPRPKSERLFQIENSVIPEPAYWVENRDRSKDASSTPITSKLNIEPSLNIHATVYRMPTDLLMSKLRVVGEKGGKVLFVPPDREKFGFNLSIFHEDILYPVCPSGVTRSQILYLVLKGVKRSLRVEHGVHLPHGAETGYDCFDDGYFKFDLPNNQDLFSTCFSMAFGVHKAPRFGEKEGKGFHSEISGPKRMEWKRIEKNRHTMKDMFDLYYYRQPQKKDSAGRIFFFVFQTALPVVISRLLELNHDKLENIFIIAIPFDDPMSVLTDGEMKRLNMPSKEHYVCHKLIETYKMYSSFVKPVKL